jgi:glycerate dehydrogenase
MAKIIVLDSNFAGDSSVWSPFDQIEDVAFFQSVNTEEACDLGSEAEVIVASRKIRFDTDLLAKLPKLKYISLLSTGYNSVDLAACKERGVIVSNVPGYSSDSVAQTAFALILELVQGSGSFDEEVKDGRWTDHENSIYKLRPFLELAGLTLGVFGFGAIGQKVAKIAEGFGMKVLACARSKKSGFEGVEFVSREDLFKKSDVVSLHCPLNGATEGMVDAEMLKLMKESAYLINTSRGAVVNEADLAEALNSNVIAGAGLDVMINEPPHVDNPLLKAKNIILLPHIAWTSEASRKRLVEISADNVRSYLNGKPLNLV